MGEDPRIQELLDEILDSDATPEEVCRGYPELLAVVRRRWQQLRRVHADLDLLFPPAGPRDFRTPEWTELPRFPGYDVEAAIGRGGMGAVFRARHLRLNRTVAVKTLLFGSAGPLERERFRREVEAIAGLKHPNIVRLYDVGEDDGRPFFTMEFVEGGNLADKLAGTPQPAVQSAELVVSLAKAVHAAHLCGILHRDLKPSNVLLASDGTPKISDFGLARRLDGEVTLTQNGMPIGTPSYMAPEQAIGGAVGKATDVYSLGAILYELLTGRPPFRAATAAETVQQVVSQEPAPPSRLNDQVPRDLETICLKCLNKEPSLRYGGPDGLSDDLGRFLGGRPIRARPVGWTEHAWRWCRRNPAAAALAVTAAAFLLLAVGGGVWVAQQRARREAELRIDAITALAQAADLRRGLHFADARVLLEQARRRLDATEIGDLRDAITRAQADLTLSEKLDRARMISSTVSEILAPGGSEPLYASAFEVAGLGRFGDDIETVAGRVRRSTLRTEIVAALDDWASLTQDPGRRRWLIAVARDADANEARNRLRNPKLWADRSFWDGPARREGLTRDLASAELTPQLATALARVARSNDADELSILVPLATRFPQDFWLQYDLGWALFGTHRKDESLGHFRAALALRPNTSAAHQALGLNLKDLGRKDEAAFHFEEAIRIAPGDAAALNSFGMALRDWGRLEEGIALVRRALAIETQRALFHRNLGLLLLDKGSRDEAIEHIRRAIQLEPGYGLFRHALIGAYIGSGRLDNALDQAREVVRLDPALGLNHYNLGAILLNLGRGEEAIGSLRKAVELDPGLQPALSTLGTTLIQAARDALGAVKPAGDDQASGRPGEPMPTARRRQALGWLRENLALRSEMMSKGKAVEWSVGEWLADSQFATVRDPSSLATLPGPEQADWQQFWSDVQALVAADPGVRGPILASRREWAKAADCYLDVSRNGRTISQYFLFEYAALLLLEGDREGYARACDQLIADCGKPGGPRSYHVARACTLGQRTAPDPSLPGRLAERELRANQESFWALTELGAIAYRSGRHQEARNLFERSLDAETRPGRAVVNWLWLALASHRLEQREEARRWLDKARAWLDQFGDGLPAGAEGKYGLDLHNWLEANVLLREAEGLIRPIDRGDDSVPRETDASRK